MQPFAATPGIAKPGANGMPTDLIDAVSPNETDGAVVIAAPVATSRSHADTASASTVTQHADTNVRIGVPFNRPFFQQPARRVCRSSATSKCDRREPLRRVDKTLARGMRRCDCAELPTHRSGSEM